MEIMFLIIGIIFIVSIIALVFVDKDNRDFIYGIFIISFLLLIISTILLLRESNDIAPIEVYRGNTTLQITYQDSIPVDSVVVYKNK